MDIEALGTPENCVADFCLIPVRQTISHLRKAVSNETKDLDILIL